MTIARNKGVSIEMTMTADTTARKHRSQPRRFIEMVISMTLTSLEKRLTILPVGVVSKNDIGERMMEYNIFSCRMVAARMLP